MAAAPACVSAGGGGGLPPRPPETAPAGADEAMQNWPEHPEKALELMTRAPVDARSATGAGAGTTGAMKVELVFPELSEDFRIKAKPVPSDLDGINNSPRKELAAWELQRLFLDPVDYVVPSTGLRCVPLDLWRKNHPDRAPTIPGTRCVLVLSALWLKNVTVPDRLYDPERFSSDYRYAYHLGNFNLFAYLINLRDNRRGNVLVSEDESDRRVFAIDNGVSFGTPWFNWFNPGTYAWRWIRVPALPRRSVERLRALRREDLEPLAVMVQMEPDVDGILWPVRPHPPLDPEDGARRVGTTLQFGLTDDEIEDLWERIEDLVEEVDEGEIALF